VLSGPIPAEVYAAVEFTMSVAPKGAEIYSVSRTVVRGWGNDVEVIFHYPNEDFLNISILTAFVTRDGDVSVDEVIVRVAGEMEVDGFLQSVERTAELDIKTGILTWVGSRTHVRNLIEEAKDNQQAN
jgi:hypothetical protein